MRIIAETKIQHGNSHIMYIYIHIDQIREVVLTMLSENTRYINTMSKNSLKRMQKY